MIPTIRMRKIEWSFVFTGAMYGSLAVMGMILHVFLFMVWIGAIFSESAMPEPLVFSLTAYHIVAQLGDFTRDQVVLIVPVWYFIVIAYSSAATLNESLRTTVIRQRMKEGQK